MIDRRKFMALAGGMMLARPANAMLMNNQLYGFGVGGVASSLTFIGYQVIVTDLSGYTFSSWTGGVTSGADPGFGLCVACFVTQNSAEGTAATLDGQSGTLVVRQTGTDQTVEIWAFQNVANAAGSLVVTLDGPAARAGAAVYRLTGVQNTAYDTMGSAANPGTGTIDVPSAGFVIAASNNNGNWTHSWTLGTEDVDVSIESTNGFGTARQSFDASQAGLTVTVTYSASGGQQAMAAASFGP